MALDRSRKARSARRRTRVDERTFLLRHHEIRAAVAAAILLVAASAACSGGSDPADSLVTITAPPPPPPPPPPSAPTTTSPPPTTTTQPPVVGTLAVEGDLVRGAPATAVASGLAAGRGLTLVVSDEGQRVPVGAVTPDASGTVRVDFVVPGVGLHEGICVDGACEYRPVGLGPHRLSLSRSAYDLTGALTVDVEIVPARRGVAYPVRVTGECGPVRADLDGRAWLADAPERFDPPGEPALLGLRGTLTLTSATKARFRGEDGSTGTFTAGARHFC